MKPLTLTFATFIIGTLFSFNAEAQSKKEKEETTIVITREKDGKEKTYTLDFSDLEKGLEDLGKSFEKFGNEMEEFFDDIEETNIEVIEVEESENDFKIKITEKQNGKEKSRELYGEEAKKYLEEKEKKSLNWMNVEGDITIDVNDDDGEDNIHIELNMNDLFEDLGIEFSEDKKEDKKIIIIKSKSKETKTY
jgi:predicted hydrocarbon binding protein